VLTPEAFESEKKRKKPRPHCKRKRRRVWEIFQELSPTYVKQAYHMDEDSFYKLHKKLRKYMTKKQNQNNKKKKNSGKNGAISTVLCLSVAIHYFAGGDPYDISIAHGISHTEVSFDWYGEW
jgi:hypothetical protein